MACILHSNFFTLGLGVSPCCLHLGLFAIHVLKRRYEFNLVNSIDIAVMNEFFLWLR